MRSIAPNLDTRTLRHAVVEDPLLLSLVAFSSTLGFWQASDCLVRTRRSLAMQKKAVRVVVLFAWCVDIDRYSCSGVVHGSKQDAVVNNNSSSMVRRWWCITQQCIPYDFEYHVVPV